MLILANAGVSSAMEVDKASAFAGQDLHMAGAKLISLQPATEKHILVFENGFSMSIGGNQFSSDKGVVWLDAVVTEFRGRLSVDYNARVYLEGNVSVKKSKSAKSTDLSQSIIEENKSMFVWFSVSGEVLVTADERQISDPRQSELYKKALAVSDTIVIGPKFVIQPQARVPLWIPEKQVVPKPVKPGIIERVFEWKKKPAEPPAIAVKPKIKEPVFRYPVHWAPAGEAKPKMESGKTPDGTDVATIIGRTYVWQWQEYEGKKFLLELQADKVVLFYSSDELKQNDENTDAKDPLAEGAIKAIYLWGDVVITEGQRTIRSDELYYDFQRKKAIAINAVMRSFDSSRGIPIYVRAAKLRLVAENKFSAENITLTTSEFYLPQISLAASSVIITDTTTIDQETGKLSDRSFDVQMKDVKFKVGQRTIFHRPFIRSNLQRPDVPLKRIHVGHGNTWGTSVETRWYLSRLLGLREPEGVESTLSLDYFSKRGFGGGGEIEYEKEDYFGRLLGYAIHDTGQDRLGRNRTRKDIEPPRKSRGRFNWLHRHFLPYNWQLTAGIDYLSDENFLEQYYRGEYGSGLKPETYLHLKRIENNWGLSLLGKGRINDFADQLEEAPSIEFHLTGQSLFDDMFTLYSDTQVSRLRQRIGNEHSTATNMTDIREEHFSFASHRTELDMPLWAKPFKVVPFVAGTFAYDDRSGFTRGFVDGTNTGRFGEDKVWIGEVGVRVGTQYWKTYPNVKSRLWDLNQLRHIISPQLTAVVYGQSDSVIEQRDVLNVGISQRLQTKRGPAGQQRNVDWMRLDTSVTWVNDSESASSSGPGPDRFIWNRPIVPYRVLSAPDIFNGDLETSLHRFEMFGPRRNYFSTDYIWRISDTSAVLSDLNFDMQSGVVQQFNVGFSRLLWPNLSYYVGSRYLRRVEVLDEKGSNALTFAATYVLDPRYTLVFAQQFDTDYGANIRSDVTLIRRYHRMYCSITFSADASLDSQAIVFSIWPQGIPEMAIGNRRYMNVGSPAGY